MPTLPQQFLYQTEHMTNVYNTMVFDLIRSKHVYCTDIAPSSSFLNVFLRLSANRFFEHAHKYCRMDVVTVVCTTSVSFCAQFELFSQIPFRNGCSALSFISGVSLADELLSPWHSGIVDFGALLVSATSNSFSLSISLTSFIILSNEISSPDSALSSIKTSGISTPLKSAASFNIFLAARVFPFATSHGIDSGSNLRIKTCIKERLQNDFEIWFKSFKIYQISATVKTGGADTAICKCRQLVIRYAKSVSSIQAPAQNSSRAVPAKVLWDAGNNSHAITIPTRPAP